MPDAGSLAYLIPLSRSLGRTDSGGFSVRPVPYSEVEAFCRMERLTAQEARVLRAMSEAYVAGLSLGRDIFSIPPWSPANG